MRQTEGTHQGDNLGVGKGFVCFAFYRRGKHLLWTVGEKKAAVGVFLTHTEQVNIVLKLCLCIRLVE